jgi:mono/diheme cytochrome c family protein
MSLALASLASTVVAQDRPVIKTVPITQTSPLSGKEMFRAYCAVCHGANGKGDGPAATALQKRPTDLTRLAASNAGKYPQLHVRHTLAVREVGTPEHLSMPSWGDLFRQLNADGDIAKIRVANLTAYLATIQE